MRWLLLVVMVAGCGPSVTPVMAPDGSHGVLVTGCNDSAACFQKAAEICPGGYNIFDRQSNTWAYVPTIYGTRNISQQELFIACRATWRQIGPNQWGWTQ